MPIRVTRISSYKLGTSKKQNIRGTKTSLNTSKHPSSKPLNQSSGYWKNLSASLVDSQTNENIQNGKTSQRDAHETTKTFHQRTIKNKKCRIQAKSYVLCYLIIMMSLLSMILFASLIVFLKTKENLNSSKNKSTMTTTSVTTETTTSATTTTTTSTIACASVVATTRSPGGIGGASVIYTFDNTSNDLYGVYNAIPVNSPTYVSPGYNGRGAAIQLLAANSQYLTVSNHMDFYQKSLTVEAWIYPFSIPIGSPYIDSIIYGQTNSSVTGQYMWMMIRNEKIYGAFYNNDVSGSTVLQINRWYHMAFTYNLSTTTQTVYVNGVADAVNPNAPPCLVTTARQSIGMYPQGGGGFFNGYIDQLQVLFNRAKSAQEILDDATLVARYAMDCITYPEWDSGPNQISGTAMAVTSSVDGGRVGQAYLFNSTSAYFQVTGLVLLGQGYSPYSFVMWLRPILSVTGGSVILHVSANNAGTGWCVAFLGLSSLGQIVAVGFNGAVVQVTGPVLKVGQWVHVAETYSQTNGLRLYVDGVLVGQSAAYTYSASGLPMVATLGQSLSGTSCARGSIGTDNYRGQIDEFYMYSRELSQADVTALANP